jgi:hypothetical protein
MITFTITLQAKTPEEMRDLRAGLLAALTEEGLLATAAKPNELEVRDLSGEVERMPLKGPVPKDDDAEKPKPKRTTRKKKDETPPPEEKSEDPPAADSSPRGRKRSSDTPAGGEASPAASSTTTAADLRNEAARLLIEHYGSKKPGKAVKDLLERFDAVTAMDVPDERAADFLAAVKAEVGGGSIEMPEKTLTEQIADELGI